MILYIFKTDSIGEYWHKNKSTHRYNAPAVSYKSGTKKYLEHNMLHREGGPAIIYANGDESWYKKGCWQYSNYTDNTLY